MTNLDKRVSDKEFELDTSSFDMVINSCKSLADKMSGLKNDLDDMRNELMFSWAGEGRNTFEKKYRILSQQFKDIKDDLYDISENLLSMEEQYIQADTDLAKALDGKDTRYF